METNINPELFSVLPDREFENYYYAAVQNGVILDIFDTCEKAEARVREEIKRDWIEIILKKKLRKLLKKKDSIALHDYRVIVIAALKEVTE